VYREIVDRFSGGPEADRAAEKLGSPGFQRELRAAQILGRLYAFTNRLIPVRGSAARFDDEAYFERNRSILIRMVCLVGEVRDQYSGTREARVAVELAGLYGLPEHTSLPISETVEVVGRIEAVSRVPSAAQIAPYRDVLTYVRYRVEKVVSGDYTYDRMVVVYWGMKNARRTDAARWRSGVRHRLKVDRFHAHPELEKVTQASDANDPGLVPYWAITWQTTHGGS